MSLLVAKRALNKALNNGGELEVLCPSRDAAVALRLTCYRFRRTLRNRLAKAEGIDKADVDMEYDTLILTIAEGDDGWYLVFTPAPVYVF